MSAGNVRSRRVPGGRSSRRNLRDIAIFSVCVAGTLYAGFQEIGHAEFPTMAALFSQFTNGVLRLFFPVAVALIAGPDLAADLAHGFIAATRSREDIRQRLARGVRSVTLRAFLVFALLTLIDAVAAFAVAPAIWPHAINPSGYGLLTIGAIQHFDVDSAPLTAALGLHPVVFSIVAASWAGVNAGVFALVTVAAVLILRRTILALLAPFAVYMLESVVFQYAGLPGPSFLISALYPSGITHYDFWQAAWPTLTLGIIALTAVSVLIRGAKANPRFS